MAKKKKTETEKRKKLAAIYCRVTLLTRNRGDYSSLEVKSSVCDEPRKRMVTKAFQVFRKSQVPQTWIVKNRKMLGKVRQDRRCLCHQARSAITQHERLVSHQ